MYKATFLDILEAEKLKKYKCTLFSPLTPNFLTTYSPLAHQSPITHHLLTTHSPLTHHLLTTYSPLKALLSLNLLARGGGGGWMKYKIRLKLSQLGCSWQLGLAAGA